MRVHATIRKARDRCRALLSRILSAIAKRLVRASSSMVNGFRVRNAFNRGVVRTDAMSAEHIIEKLFEASGDLPNDIPSVDDLLGLLPSITEEIHEEISCEVFCAGEPRWNLIPAQFVKLPIDLVREAGIAGLKTEDILLYIRERCFQQLKFLDEFVLKKGRIGRVHGQPGTGKSMTGLFFAVHLATKRNWNVLWIHLMRSSYECLHMRPDGSKHKAVITNDEELYQLIRTFHESVALPCGGHAIFIDALVEKDSIVVKEVDRWFIRDRNNRRIIILTSDGICNGFNDESADIADQSVFRQWSWKLEEYQRAMTKEDFRKRTEPLMDADHELFTDDVLAKFFYAGGCARYMFHFSTVTVKKRIDAAIRKQQLSFSRGEAASCLSLASVNRLFGFKGPDTYDIISEYARNRMVDFFGEAELLNLARNPLIRDNSSTVGSLFEIFCKRRVSDTGIIRLNPQIEWTIDGVVDMHMPHLSFANAPINKIIWPICKQQATFDALVLFENEVSKTRTIKFIQVTIAQKHVLDLEVLRKMMVLLKAKEAEFYVVRPSAHIRPVYMYPIDNPRAMIGYKWGETTDEIRNRIYQTTIDGWNV